MSELLHPNAPHDLPSFITAPGDTDVLMVAVGVILLGAVLAVGNIYLRLHTLPERMAHRSQKLQFEIVAVLGLLALFTHMHVFWVAGLLLAMIDLPDFSTPLRSIAGSVATIAGVQPGTAAPRPPHDIATADAPDLAKPNLAKPDLAKASDKKEPGEDDAGASGLPGHA
ncbi:hypothetical protein GGQ85_000463 [Nitrobacter vulgaris]|uniref:hypothetical protein n=1 Tax=Nitrobacter vulgaris TaxID=29421 RepID=UPI0028555A07|nr:hypothetical protein [Nitrobacter vulgaris]MDR6302783.1 hypothetical protein [Nitrobacter vulgaris]